MENEPPNLEIQPEHMEENENDGIDKEMPLLSPQKKVKKEKKNQKVMKRQKTMTKKKSTGMKIKKKEPQDVEENKSDEDEMPLLSPEARGEEGEELSESEEEEEEDEDEKENEEEEGKNMKENEEVDWEALGNEIRKAHRKFERAQRKRKRFLPRTRFSKDADPKLVEVTRRVERKYEKMYKKEFNKMMANELKADGEKTIDSNGSDAGSLDGPFYNMEPRDMPRESENRAGKKSNRK